MITLQEPTPPPPPPAPEVPPPPGWEGILAPGERILWQGRPAPGTDWASLLDTRRLFGLVFAGFAVFWMAKAFDIGSNHGAIGYLIPLFGLPFLAAGLKMAGGDLLLAARQRRRTWYTLTDRNAFIATEGLGGRKLSTHPLVPSLVVRLEDGEPGTIWFGQRTVHRTVSVRGLGMSRASHSARTLPGPAGFERIPDARTVYGRILEVQRAAASRAQQGGA